MPFDDGRSGQCRAQVSIARILDPESTGGVRECRFRADPDGYARDGLPVQGAHRNPVEGGRGVRRRRRTRRAVATGWDGESERQEDEPEGGPESLEHFDVVKCKRASPQMLVFSHDRHLATYTFDVF